MRLILFNGPPRSGKDTSALIAEEFLCKLPSNPVVDQDKFSLPNKVAFAAMMRTTIDEDFNVPYYEQHKEEVVPSLGVSYRQWQIDFSEKFMKPLYGQDIFARLLWERNTTRLEKFPHIGPDYLVVSDCGFQVEVDYVLSRCKPDEVILFRLYRPNCSFKNDSRNYVFNFKNDMYEHAVYNYEGIDELKIKLHTYLEIWTRNHRENQLA